MIAIKFLKAIGRREGQGSGPEYEADKVYKFDGWVAEGYARSYIDRGWAEEYVEPKPEPKPEPRPAAAATPKVEAGSDKATSPQGKPATTK